jgi:hypothetical protein
MTRRAEWAALCGSMLLAALAVPLAADGNPVFTAPYEFQTRHGTFRIPRAFAPIEEWKTMRVDPQATDYFLARLPADHVAGRIEGFAPELNFFRQDVVVAVEALSDRRRKLVAAKPAELCWVAPHDTEPRSTPYDRCEYRLRTADELFAVKFWLNGDNRRHRAAVGQLIESLLMEWKAASPPPR